MFVPHVMASATQTAKRRLALLGSVSTAAAMFLIPNTAAAQATTCAPTGRAGGLTTPPIIPTVFSGVTWRNSSPSSG